MNSRNAAAAVWMCTGFPPAACHMGSANAAAAAWIYMVQSHHMRMYPHYIQMPKDREQ